MTRLELAKRLRAEFKGQMSGRVLQEAVSLFFAEITAAVTSGGRVEIRGLGTFFSTTFPVRRSRNPRTGRNLGRRLSVRVRYRPSANL